MGILRCEFAALRLNELVFLAESDVPVRVQARDVLHELLNGDRGTLAVLFAVLPFLKRGHVARWIIEEVVRGVEAFPENWPQARPNEFRHKHAFRTKKRGRRARKGKGEGRKDGRKKEKTNIEYESFFFFSFLFFFYHRGA